MNANVENRGCLYLLPKASMINEGFSGAGAKVSFCNDMESSVCERLGINGEPVEIEYNSKFFKKVYDFMIKEYESISSPNQEDGFDYFLDFESREYIESCSMEVFLNITVFDSIYNAALCVMKNVISVILMADYFNEFADAYTKSLEFKVAEYIQQQKIEHENLFLDDIQ